MPKHLGLSCHILFQNVSGNLVPKRLWPKRLRPKRIGTETTRCRNGLVPKRQVPNFMNPYRSFSPFVPGSPGKHNSANDKRNTSLENPGSKICRKLRCIRKFNYILLSRDNSAVEEGKWYVKAHPKQHGSRTKPQNHFCDYPDNFKYPCIGVQNP